MPAIADSRDHPHGHPVGERWLDGDGCGEAEKIEGEEGEDTPQRDAEQPGIHGEGDEGEEQSEGQGGDEEGEHGPPSDGAMEPHRQKEGVGQTDGLHEGDGRPIRVEQREDGHREDGEAKPDAGLQEGRQEDGQAKYTNACLPSLPHLYSCTKERSCPPQSAFRTYSLGRTYFLCLPLPMMVSSPRSTICRVMR